MAHETALFNLRMADLSLFITAAHLQNLGKAAAAHHVSQSAASSAIQRVEAAFGRPLCRHEKRQFRLTTAGELLLPKAEHWLRQLLHTVATQESLPIRLVTTHAIARVTIAKTLSIETIEWHVMRPDKAYAAVLRGDADVAITLDNAAWDGVLAAEIGSGFFQLYSRQVHTKPCPILLPEDQIEVLTLQQRWQESYQTPLGIKARIPSWSLIADICSTSSEVGLLPDFLAAAAGLLPVDWQPQPSPYRILALYNNQNSLFLDRIHALIESLTKIFRENSFLK